MQAGPFKEVAMYDKGEDIRVLNTGFFAIVSAYTAGIVLTACLPAGGKEKSFLKVSTTFR